MFPTKTIGLPFSNSTFDIRHSTFDYIELEVTSNFSFLRGGSHPEELVEQAAKLGYPAIAVTDRNSLAGIVRAHAAAKEHHIRLIVGCRLVFQNAPLSLLVYPTDLLSYGRLCKLLTLGKFRAEKGSCLLNICDLDDFHQGLLAIVVVDDLSSEALISSLRSLLNIFSQDRLSLALSNTYGADGASRLERLIEICQTCRILPVITNDVYYHTPERRFLQDILTCIRLNCKIYKAEFELFQNSERYLKSPHEMRRLFSRYPQALERSCEIAKEALRFSLDEVHYEYPKEVCPEEKSPIEYLEELTWKGACERYVEYRMSNTECRTISKPIDTAEATVTSLAIQHSTFDIRYSISPLPPNVVKQIRSELALIAELDYAKYFLTVYDIVQFARSRGILCQGRGAAANSAVCYCLGITSVDPDRIKLLFERFVSKERNEPPDIDIDFEHERREEVIQYIYNKYGRHRSALVASVITYRTKSACRDIGKVFGLPESVTSLIAKILRRSEGKTIPDEVLSNYGLNPTDPRIYHTLTLAQTIKTFPRHLSQHVGGFVISDKELCSLVPIEHASMSGRTVIEWDKDDVDKMGMLKIDVLGLGMLSCIRKALQTVNGQEGISSQISGITPKPVDDNTHSNFSLGPQLLLHTIPPEDPAVYEMICAADTLGVFQIESRAQMSMLPRLRPRCFYDLVIEIAIVRPGPIQGGLVHPYLRRRQGKEPVTYPDERIRNILENTLGVPIFQEQIMELAIVGAGFTPGEADRLRRSISSWKRNKKLMEQFGAKITEGLTASGYSRDFAELCIKQIQGFSEYGFPQSHAASFALLVYVSAWLKKHYPAHFASALLNSQPMGFYQPSQIIQDAKLHGVEVRPVDVQHSSWDCTLEGNPPVLRLGMRLIKGLREEEAKRIVHTINSCGKFSTIVSLWKKSGVRVNTLRILAAADAFLSLGFNRQKALWQIQQLRDEPLPLFARISENCDTNFSFLPEFSELSQVLKDYQHTGLSLKGHPLQFFRAELNRRGVSTIQYYKEHSQAEDYLLAGLVLVRQQPLTASGVVFVTIEDETGSGNLVIFPQIFKHYRDIICDSNVLLVKGKRQQEESVTHLIVEKAWDISSYLNKLPTQSRDFH